MARFGSPAVRSWLSPQSWRQRLLRGPCPGCTALARAPLCRACQADSGIAEGGWPQVTLLENDLRVAYLGLYWRGSQEGSSHRQPTPLAHGLHRFKFGGDRYAGHCLARLFAESLSNWVTDAAGDTLAAYDAIVPVPLSMTGLRARRFNQSAWLARRLARRTRVAYRPGWLRRCGGSQPQHGLGAVARRANMRGAFGAGRLPAQPARVLVIDDVCTTGATLAEAVRVLAEAGAGHVDAAVLVLAEALTDGNRK